MKLANINRGWDSCLAVAITLLLVVVVEYNNDYFSIMKVKVKWKSLSHVWFFVTPWIVHGVLQARTLEWVAFPFSRGSSNPGIESRDQTQASCTAGKFFTSWATRETQECWVGSLSLHQCIFPTQESNQSLLHCRRILYQLSYQGSPFQYYDF